MDAVPVEVARIPDLEELLRALKAHGLEAREHQGDDWLGVEIPCGEEATACEDVVHQLETWLAEMSLPLVPVRAEGRVFLRPPSN